MPAQAPPVSDRVAARLAGLGAAIRGRRKALGVSATVTAEAAGMSRTTLHRIERGEVSVAMGAYMSVVAALGLELEVFDPEARRAAAKTASPAVPPKIQLADYPQLAALAWQLHGVTELSPPEALELYERNWRHVDHDAMDPAERALVTALVNQLGGGRPLV